MKNIQCGICIAIAVATATFASVPLVFDDYESDTVGTRPSGSDHVRPSTIQTNLATVVVGGVTNIAGTGNAVRILDDHTSGGVRFYYDVCASADDQVSAVRVDFSFAPLSTLGNGGGFNVAVGEYGKTLTSSSQLFLGCLLRDDGTVDFTSSAGPDSLDHVLLASNNTLSIFVNDLDSDGILYTGLDGEAYVLAANSVAYWLNGDRIDFGGAGQTKLLDQTTAAGTIFTSTNNIGRIGFRSQTSTHSPDYIIDDLVISALPLDVFPMYDGVNGLVYEGANGLVYAGYANEGQDNPVNTVPDFSNAGYQGGGVSIPFIPTALVVSNSNGSADDTALIQTAINTVSALPVGTNGFRGAVLIKAGEYSVSNTLNVAASGVVIRGEGSQETGGTKITYTKTENSNLFEVDNAGDKPREVSGTRQAIMEAYVPVGAKSFTVADASGFAVGDRIVVQNLMNQQWIDDMSNMGQWGWTASNYQLKFYRVIKAIAGNYVTLDAPIVQTIETQYGGGVIYKYNFNGQLENIGFEGLRLESVYAGEEDENHGWDAIVFKRLQNGWVRQVTAKYFGYGLLSLKSYCRQITVEDCAMLDPKSITTGGRKYSFSIDDSDYIFVQRCFTRGGRHDFATHSQTPGPNVFSDCRANTTHADIGPHHRYATGQLYDNIKGGQIRVQNREDSGSGHGWAGAQVMIWNCDAPKLVCDAPVGAMNWCVGSVGSQDQGQWAPDEPFGIWFSHNTPVALRSLYHAQLQERLGTAALRNTIIPMQEEGDIWAELNSWDGDGLFADEVVVWADATVVASGGTVNLKGVCRNLQLLENGVSYTWSQVSGPGPVSFGTTTSQETSATILGSSGNYVIQLVVDDGTTQASNTVTVAVTGVPLVENAGAVPIDLDSVELRGQLFSATPAALEMVWDVADQGTNLLAWTGRQALPAQTTGSFGAEVDGLQPGSNWVYRCMASNEYGIAWSEASLFALHPHGYIRLEDFEAYSQGVNIGGQGSWGGNAGSGAFTVQVDPENADNQVLWFDEGVGEGVYLNPAELRVANGTTSTLFLRFRGLCQYPGDPDNRLWIKVALSDLTAPTQFSHGETDAGINDDGSGNMTMFTTTAGAFEQLKWLRVWLVVDNAADTFDAYVQPEGEAQVQVLNNKAFRNGSAANDLVSLMLRTLIGTGGSQGDGWFDDIYISHGADMHAYSPVGIDQDMDGLGDSWELGQFGSYTASAGGAADYDGDGFIDLHEYLAGTGGADGGSLLEITGAQPVSANNELVLWWQAVADKSYAIKGTTNLTDGTWNPVAAGIPGVEPLCTHTVQTETVETFYRIELEQ